MTLLEARVNSQAEDLALFRLTINPPLGVHTLLLYFHIELRRLLQAGSKTNDETIKVIEIEAIKKFRRTINLIWWGTKVDRGHVIHRLRRGPQ